MFLKVYSTEHWICEITGFRVEKLFGHINLGNTSFFTAGFSEYCGLKFQWILLSIMNFQDGTRACTGFSFFFDHRNLWYIFQK